MTFPLRLRSRCLSPLLASLVASAAVCFGEESPAGFHLANDDIPKAVLVAEKPGRMFVELTYSRDKQDELRKLTAADLPKAVDMRVADIPLGERLFKSAAKGHSLKFDFASLDNALELIDALGWAKRADDDPVTTAPEASLIEFTADDVGRVILYMFRSPNYSMEVTCLPAKRDELLYLLHQTPARPVLVSVNGRIIAELPPGAKVSPAGGIRFDLTSPSIAINTARTLARRP